MRLTAFSDVSLRIMMLLSSLQEGEKLSTQKISEGVGTPYNHVAKSVAFLVNQGLLESTRGRSGGVLLSETGRKATVGQVLRSTEGDIPMIECEDENGNCPLDSFCRLRTVLARAREAFYASVDDVVISELPAGACWTRFCGAGVGAARARTDGARAAARTSPARRSIALKTKVSG